jgi:hypothetical protein
VGAKYEPSDKEEFIKNIPIAKLERFLGKLRVISVEFVHGGWAQISVLGFWRVVAQVEQSNGTILKYDITFEQFNGHLTSITTLPNQPLLPSDFRIIVARQHCPACRKIFIGLLL